MVDYCKSRLSVATRVLHFLDEEDFTIDENTTFEGFQKQLAKTDFKRSCGFTKSKKGYMDALWFAYNIMKLDAVYPSALNLSEVCGKDPLDN